jgi:hypothetical protein
MAFISRKVGTHPWPTKNCAKMFKENIASPALGPRTWRHKLPIGCPYCPATISVTSVTVYAMAKIIAKPRYNPNCAVITIARGLAILAFEHSSLR